MTQKKYNYNYIEDDMKCEVYTFSLDFQKGNMKL